MWIREYCSQFVIAYGRQSDGFPYSNTRAQKMMQRENRVFGAPPEGGGLMPSAPSSYTNTDRPGRWGIMVYNPRCTQMYKCFGRLADPKTGLLMADHAVCCMMEIAVMKLFSHGRSAEIYWGGGLQNVSSILHNDGNAHLLSSSNAKYCPIYRIGNELSDLLEAHLAAWKSLNEPDEGTPKDKDWYEQCITGKREIHRVIGNERRMPDLMLESCSDDIC